MRYAIENGLYLGEEQRQRKDGSVFDAEVALHVVRGPDGQPIGFAKVTEDISDQKKSQRDADATREFLQQLLAIVGHDLRNPLHAIAMSADLLRTALVGQPELLDVVKRVCQAADRSTRIASDLLDLSQSQLVGAIAIAPAVVDFGLHARQIVDEYRAAHPDREICLEVRGPAIGTWDGSRLMQALSNLLANAVQHARADRPVTVEVEGTADAMSVAVHNWGTPIPESLKPDLFKPFRRGAQPSTVEKSLGLGLHIVERIIVAHGGSIELESTAETGTRFRFWLPKSAPLSRA